MRPYKGFVAPEFLLRRKLQNDTSLENYRVSINRAVAADDVKTAVERAFGLFMLLDSTAWAVTLEFSRRIGYGFKSICWASFAAAGCLALDGNGRFVNFLGVALVTIVFQGLLSARLKSMRAMLEATEQSRAEKYVTELLSGHGMTVTIKYEDRT